MKRIRYSLNWMGPAYTKWYTDRGLDINKEPYSTGRIDFFNPYEDSPYPDELYVPPIRTEDWNSFSNWLDTFETDDVWDFCQLVWLYERDNPKIRWYEAPVWYPYNPHEVKE